MIALAALAGAVSPFCSCGVIPLIAALLAMRVPLPAVMAFWLASPLMDPSMFVLTAGALGLEFALYKTAAAVVTGCLGGLTVLALGRTGAFTDTLRPGVGASRCSASKLLSGRNVTWTFWRESARLDAFLRSATRTTLFLGKWLALAYLLESVLLTFVPQEQVVAFIGGQGIRSTLLAVLVGIPAYLNGYAALPLVGGLLEQGMDPAAGMAFLLAGGVTSIPAAMAVFALVRLRVFAVYLGVALVAALGLGTGYGLIAG